MRTKSKTSMRTTRTKASSTDSRTASKRRVTRKTQFVRHIEIVTIAGTESVRVLASYGPFAIHVTAGKDGPLRGNYTVTHVGSGYAAERSAKSRRSALRLARLLTRCGIDWNFTGREGAQRIVGHSAGISAVRRWRELEEGH